MWEKLLLILLAGLIGWLVYRTIRGNPQAFSREMFSKSAYTMGLLALFLIALIGFCVLILH